MKFSSFVGLLLLTWGAVGAASPGREPKNPLQNYARGDDLHPHDNPKLAHGNGVVDGIFFENFQFFGNHAGVSANGRATTVWWDEDLWDVRMDHVHNSLRGQGHYVAIHKAKSSQSIDGRVDDGTFAIGGDGGEGVGLMHVDYEGIVSARLRNPVRIAAGKPAVLSFLASRFVTTGHWWEVAITPARQIIGAEHTAVPDANHNALIGPMGHSVQNGPGHTPVADSINLVSFGATDVPCRSGWHTRLAVTKSVGDRRHQVINAVQSYDQLYATHPDERDRLFAWRIEFWPSKMTVSADFDRDGQLELLETFKVDIPWSQVHLHLIGAAYQADHHPQVPCFQGQARDFVWRGVRASPVVYDHTRVFPKNAGVRQRIFALGFAAYDLRDTHRFGTVQGLPQPNAEAFDRHRTRLLSHGEVAWPRPQQTDRFVRRFDVPGIGRRRPDLARFNYDVRGGGGVLLYVNDVLVGELDNGDTVPGKLEGFARRSVVVDAELLQKSDNRLRLELDGTIELDRLEWEFAYRQP